MTGIIAAALIASSLLYVIVGLRLRRRTRVLADMIPVRRGHNATVKSATEFSASTVATTISLATVVLAFFELAPYLGLWLLWTVVTTSLGLLVVRLAAHRIWSKLKEYNERIPTLHEFLSTEFSNPSLAIVAASCTSLGFLGALALELTVGSRFLAGLIPDISPIYLVIILAVVVLTYTSAGGFRAVIVTDRVQMMSIRLLLVLLIAYYIYTIMASNDTFQQQWNKVSPEIWDFSQREGLTAFLIGIFVINVPTFLSDMSIWQRITSTQNLTSAFSGLSKSIAGAALTWTGFVVLACFITMIVAISAEQNPLFTFATYLENSSSTLNSVVLFVLVAGLLGAMLSTGSTQLIAVSHALYEDIIGPIRRKDVIQRAESHHELILSRMVLVGIAAVAIALVEILTHFGFSIADLVFAIWGAQLGLFPPVFLSLFLPRGRLQNLGKWAMAAIVLGFLGGWGSAIAGKMVENGNLVFLAPAVSLCVSGSTLIVGTLLTRSGLER